MSPNSLLQRDSPESFRAARTWAILSSGPRAPASSWQRLRWPLWDLHDEDVGPRSHMWVCIHKYIHIYIYICMYTDFCMHAGRHTCMHVITYVYIYTHIRIYNIVKVYIYMYTHLFSHSFVCRGRVGGPIAVPRPPVPGPPGLSSTPPCVSCAFPWPAGIRVLNEMSHIHYITLHYITLHYITLQYITLHYTTLRYITLPYVTLRYITLHYTTLHAYTYIHVYTY